MPRRRSGCVCAVSERFNNEAIGLKPDLKRLAEAVRKAEAELDVAKGRTATNEAAKRLMRAREALKEAEQATRPASGAKSSADAS